MGSPEIEFTDAEGRKGRLVPVLEVEWGGGDGLADAEFYLHGFGPDTVDSVLYEIEWENAT